MRTSLDWKFEACSTFYSSPAVTADRVYIVFREKLWAIDLSDGELAWIETIGRHVDRQSPIVGGETVLIGDRNIQNFANITTNDVNDGIAIYGGGIESANAEEPQACGQKEQVLTSPIQEMIVGLAYTNYLMVLGITGVDL